MSTFVDAVDFARLTSMFKSFSPSFSSVQIFSTVDMHGCHVDVRYDSSRQHSNLQDYQCFVVCHPFLTLYPDVMV